MDIGDEIYKFISIHEAQVSNDIKKHDTDFRVTFTTHGSRAGYNAVYEIIKMLDYDTQLKVIEMMRNKRVL